METLTLKYGINPNQKEAFVSHPDTLPIKVLSGRAGYINLLDALNAWQLVSELKETTGYPAAASFKHVSPAGAAIAVPLTDKERKMYFVSSKTELSPLATAYIRARGADRMSSFGDFIALSDECDVPTAKAISREVSDGIIAPGYSAEALEILKAKKKGAYTVIEIDASYKPSEKDVRTIFGITFTQDRNTYVPSDEDFEKIVTRNTDLPESAKLDLKVAMTALKYTQSNSVVYAYHGQTIGVGAGQQSRLHCTRLAGDKADRWNLRQSDRVLSLPFRKELTRNEKDNVIEQYLTDDPETDVTACWEKYFTEPVKPLTTEEKKEYLKTVHGISLASDAFFPFSDNILRAIRSGVDYISEPGGSLRDDEVIACADEHNKVMVFNRYRLFHH